MCVIMKDILWHGNAVVITTAQVYLTKPKLRFRAVSNYARGILEVWDDENL